MGERGAEMVRGRAWRRWRAEVRFADALQRERRNSTWTRDWIYRRLLRDQSPYTYYRRLSFTVVVEVPVHDAEEIEIMLHHKARLRRDTEWSWRSDHNKSPRYSPWNRPWTKMTQQERRSWIGERNSQREY